MNSQLIQTQSPAPHLSVSVWREPLTSHSTNPISIVYRKIWKDEKSSANSAWLSWAHHEHLMLSLLSQRSTDHVVRVSGLQVSDSQVELVTHDAGPDLMRDWLIPARQTGHGGLFNSEIEALKFLRACLKALLSLHSLGVVHGDIKADNLCVHAVVQSRNHSRCMDLDTLKLIDFAYTLYKQAPMRFVLPTDPSRLDYLPDFYRQAIQTSQSKNDPVTFLSVACANIDLFSLSVLLRQVADPVFLPTWAVWKGLITEIEELGSQQPIDRLFQIQRTFDHPTKKILLKVENLLRQQNVDIQTWSCAQTVLPAQPEVTPLLVEPTALIEMTPLIGYPMAVMPSRVSPYVETALPIHKFGNELQQHPRLLTVGGLISSACIFATVDRAYDSHQLVLSDAAYVCGLLSFVLGALLSFQTLQVLIRPGRDSLRWWCIWEFLLFCLSLFFSATVAFQIENLFILIFLVAQAWTFLQVKTLMHRH